MVQQSFEASRSAKTPSSSEPETATAVSGIEDVIVEGGTNVAHHMNDLLSLLTSGRDLGVALVELHGRLAEREAKEEALSNTQSAYHRMAMAVIGNMKA